MDEDTEQHQALNAIADVILALKDNLLEEKVGLSWQHARLSKTREALHELLGALSVLDKSYDEARQQATTLLTFIENNPGEGENARIYEIRTQTKNLLKTLTPRPGKGILRRRKLLAVLGLAGAAVLASHFTRVEHHPPPEPPRVEWRMTQNAYYVQLAAHSTREETRQFQQRIGLGIIYQANAPNYQYKLILPQAFDNLDDANDAIDSLEQRDQLPKGIGIITINPDGSTTWKKTIEEQIIEEAQAPSAAKPYNDQILAAVHRHPLTANKEADIKLIHAIITVESENNPTRTSRRGAQGLMQLMPKTFEEMHHQGNAYYHPPLFTTGAPHTCNILDPEQNIDAGVRYLASLFKRYPPNGPNDVEGKHRILRMYNAGPNNVLKGRANKWRETREYPHKVEVATLRE